jgi:hypothetical protein
MNAMHQRFVAGWAFALAFAWSCLPAFAHACPMCFNGNNQNQEAFLWGSLFLMFTPTTAIGGLVYWAWRRARAHDEPAAEPPSVPHVASGQPLRLLEPR